jgi:hypothetical protein
MIHITHAGQGKAAVCVNPGTACKGSTGSFADVSITPRTNEQGKWTAASGVRVQLVRWDAASAHA